MKKIEIFTVDAFTNQLFQGNPAAVVPFADGLCDKEMQNIAREMNLSETAFLFKSDNSDFRIRYFSPTDEIDFCGHATIAASWVLGTRFNKIEKPELIFETNIGIVPVEWNLVDKKLQSVMMTQVEPIVRNFDGDIVELLNILRLRNNQIEDNYKIKLAYTGNWHLLVPIKTKEIIDSVKPIMKELTEHNLKLGVTTTHLFSINNNDIYTRDFAPAVGVDEDPVTGSANGALAGYLALEGILPQENQYTITQGNSLDRIGILDIRTSIKNNKMEIKVGGSAVIVTEGIMYL